MEQEVVYQPETISTTNLSHEEWLETRKRGIGGSDVGAILGMSRFKTPLQVFYEKTGKAEKTPVNNFMKAGIYLEPVIAKWFTDETGKRVQNDNKIRFHKELPFLLANIDRLIIADEVDPTGILECKTTGQYNQQEWEAGEVPLSYWAQVQHYMSVTGHPYSYLAVLIGGNQFKSIRVEADQEFITMMNDRLVSFWEENVLRDIPPAPINVGDVNLLYPKHRDSVFVQASDAVYDIYTQLKEVKTLISDLEKKEESLSDQLKMVLLDAEGLTYNQETLVTWKAAKDSNSFDSKAFQKAHPDLYNQFTVTKPGSRRFLVK